MRRFYVSLLWLSCLLLLFGAQALAQNEPPAALRPVTGENLKGLLVGGKIASAAPLEINVTGNELQVEGASLPLQEWVQAGGILVLHTDAARLFGFQTVKPRQRSRNRAGQKWGCAKNALPFGAHPLLWNVADTEGEGQGLPGLKIIFYNLDDDEVLLSNVGFAVPLLRHQETTISPNDRGSQPLYIAAVRRFGRGW
ncbi:hypothetical protein EON80_28320, partial [bacterium]